MLLKLSATTCHPQNQKKLQVSELVADFQLPWPIVMVSFQLILIFNFVVSPPPGHYRLVSDFDIGDPKKGVSITKRHLYSFGASHATYKKVYNPDNPIPINIEGMPGPGQYNDKTMTIGYDSLKFKFQGRAHNMAGKLFRLFC
jgi:hypothetical protein